MVVVNKEENRELDVRRLRESGTRVWVTEIATVPGAVTSLERLVDEVLGWARPGWLAEARGCGATEAPPVHQPVAIPIWRDPWMVVGGVDVHRRPGPRLGLGQRVRRQHDRYPKVEPAEIEAAGVDLVLLPDEPYVFTADDGPEAFARTETRLVSGRLLTWYGPSLVEAHEVLSRGAEH